MLALRSTGVMRKSSGLREASPADALLTMRSLTGVSLTVALTHRPMLAAGPCCRPAGWPRPGSPPGVSRPRPASPAAMEQVRQLRRFGIVAGWPEILRSNQWISEIGRPTVGKAEEREAQIARPLVRGPAGATAFGEARRGRRWRTPARRGPDPGTRRAHPQPQERLHRHPAQQPGGHHRPVRLRQVVARVRHPLRGRPAPLRRVAVGVCPPVPAADGEARRRPDRRPVAGDRDRAEIDQPQSRARPSAR